MWKGKNNFKETEYKLRTLEWKELRWTMEYYSIKSRKNKCIVYITPKDSTERYYTGGGQEKRKDRKT